MKQKFRKSPVSENSYQLLFTCPGCNQEHAIDGRWWFNNDLENPTISPSYLLKSHYFNGEKDVNIVCHSFIKDGKIQFLNDCSHELKGKTVELPIYQDLSKYTEISDNSKIYIQV